MSVLKLNNKEKKRNLNKIGAKKTREIKTRLVTAAAPSNSLLSPLNEFG